MRRSLLDQLPLVPSIDHRHSRDLARMSHVLDKLPEDILAHVERELCGDACSDRGRRGLCAEQVLRVLVLKQLTGMSYERLAFALEDSMTYRAFCRLGAGDEAPKKSALQFNVKRLSPETLELIHHAVVRIGIELGVDDAQRVSIDSTAVEANIHHPTDSSLLWDCVRKLTDLLEDAKELTSIRFSDHRKRAKRRALEIGNAKRMSDRVPLYRDLLDVVGFCLQYVKDAVGALRAGQLAARALADMLEHYAALASKVCSQARRRVLLGESVPPAEKIVSIFEPETDIIIKDNRETTYGHKAFLTVGESGLVLDLHVPRGNPGDVTLAAPLVAALEEHIGVTPLETAFDGGFCSHHNLEAIKKLGVRAVAFTAPRGLSIRQMTGTKKRFRALRRFRACIEGTIGWLKNVFGLRRCTFRSFRSFQSYTWASTLALNLLVIARHL